MSPQEEQAALFEQAALPHLGAAFNLARWLMKNDADADDVIQDAYVRALKSFGQFRGNSSKTWLLAIVRNCCFTALHKGKPAHFTDQTAEPADQGPDPEAELIRTADARRLNAALEALVPEFREVFVLRELEGLSYKEIASVSSLPIGTVMSRLSRARRDLRRLLGQPEVKL